MNMYVSNLSFNTGDNELLELFSQHGTVTSAKVILDRDTNRSRGFGFVEMPNQDEAREAMKALDNTDIEGRSLSVTEARPKSSNTFEKSYRSNNRR